MYLQYQVSEKGADKKTSTVFYSILILYILSTAIIALDVAQATGEVYLSHNSAGTNNNLLNFYQRFRWPCQLTPGPIYQC